MPSKPKRRRKPQAARAVCLGNVVYQAGEWLCLLCGAFCSRPGPHYPPAA